MKYDIWIEGYAATGERGYAHIINKKPIEANSFDEAVIKFMKENPNYGIEKNTRSRYISDEAYNNRRSNWNIWACNLFDNEKDARKIFG